MTTKIVNSNPAKGEVYLIELYVVKLASDLRQVGVFCFCFLFFFSTTVSTSNKIYHHDIQYNWIIVESGVKHDNSNTVIT